MCVHLLIKYIDFLSRIMNLVSLQDIPYPTLSVCLQTVRNRSRQDQYFLLTVSNCFRCGEAPIRQRIAIEHRESENLTFNLSPL